MVLLVVARPRSGGSGSGGGDDIIGQAVQPAFYYFQQEADYTHTTSRNGRETGQWHVADLAAAQALPLSGSKLLRA
jgi:hypothetical protein